MEAKYMSTDIAESAQAAEFANDSPSIYQRLINLAKDAGKAANVISRKVSPESDVAFQRAMAPITQRATHSEDTVVPMAYEAQTLATDAGLECKCFDIDARRVNVSERYVTHPRERRLLEVLYAEEEVSRHQLDGLIGAENSPDVVFRMRCAGWELPCKRRMMLDRDGKKCRPGFYRLSDQDRQVAAVILGFRRGA